MQRRLNTQLWTVLPDLIQKQDTEISGKYQS